MSYGIVARKIILKMKSKTIAIIPARGGSKKDCLIKNRVAWRLSVTGA
jgi:hypothetical protein